MDFPKKKSVPNLEMNANILSHILFQWLGPILTQGSKTTLGLDDLYDTLDENKAELLGNNLEKKWLTLVHKSTLNLPSSLHEERKEEMIPKNSPPPNHQKSSFKIPILYKGIFYLNWKRLICIMLLLLIDECGIRIAQPIFVRYFVQSFNTNNTNTDNNYEQYFYGISLCILTLLHVMAMQLTYYALFRIGSKSRIALSSLIYKKVLKLSKTKKSAAGLKKEEETCLGQILNLLSTDVNLDFEFGISLYIFIGPIQFILLSYLLWNEFGISALAGICCLIVLGPIQYALNFYGGLLRNEIAKRTDKRANMMSELIAGMRIIKMYAWEYPFGKLIQKLRRKELEVIQHKAFVRAIVISLFNLSSKLVLFCIVLAFVLQGHVLTSEKVFFAVTICSTMTLGMMLVVPNAVGAWVQIIVGLRRIERFLCTDEQKSNLLELFTCSNVINNGKIESVEHNSNANEVKLELKNVCASWTTEKETIRDISISLKSGQLVMIIGPVGSGKSSLLNILLSELPITKGTYNLYNGKSSRISYCPQEAWLFPGTIRQNIIYDQIYNKELYQQIINATALEHDFQQFPSGDLSRIGDSSLALSGGQKIRVNLARSLYRLFTTDIFLFDDPLSALDTQIGQLVFEQCFEKLLDKKLRILVTHQLQYLHKADYIIVLDQGQILYQGSYTELESNPDFKSYLEYNKQEISNNNNSLDGKDNIILNQNADNNVKLKNNYNEEQESKGNTETIQSGSVGGRIYWNYFKSGGSSCFIILILFGFLLNQILYVSTSAWLSHWTNMEASKAVELLNENNSTNSTSSTSFKSFIQNTLELEQHEYFYIYCGLVGTMTSGFLLVGIIFFQYNMKIGVNLHNQVFQSLVRAQIHFFDVTPIGRILNRFTKDLNGIDELLPMTIYETAQILLQNICIVFTVTLSNYYMLIPTVIIFFIMNSIRNYYLKTVRAVKRLDSAARSPLFVHVNATYQGLTTVRALSSQERLLSEFHAHQDIHSSVWFVFLALGRWFAIRLELITVIYLSCTVAGFLLMAGSVPAGTVGLAISLILVVTGSLQWGIRQSVELTNLMTSVERIFEYCALGSEPSLESTPECKPPNNWPSNGTIQFQSVSLTYNNNNIKVLNQLNFNINSKEKVGICGRTGAGKSSLISTLFRLTKFDGEIFIDGICINNIGLHDLRKKISIIPQDPILFSGTIRYNLDPFDEFEDMQLWQVLQQVELKNEINSLDYEISESGGNFSVGQKQLICLARAILRNNNIIILDEATANIDLRTDQLIQTTIRKEFAHCTMLIVAHRLQTIMDCDKILVLENGHLVENGPPKELLKNPQGHFSKMVAQAGIS